jgi:hypothetical protein
VTDVVTDVAAEVAVVVQQQQQQLQPVLLLQCHAVARCCLWQWQCCAQCAVQCEMQLLLLLLLRAAVWCRWHCQRRRQHQ